MEDPGDAAIEHKIDSTLKNLEKSIEETVLSKLEQQEEEQQNSPTIFSDGFQTYSQADVTQVLALYDNHIEQPGELSFKKGEILKVINDEPSNGWLLCSLNGIQGWAPLSYVSPDIQGNSVDFQDEEYFGAYSDLNLQKEMLSDKPRTLAYKEAIEKNSPFIKDKVVLDVGCGSGILSFFCAKSEAKMVYGVDASEFATKAKTISEFNKFENVTILKGKLEAIKIPEKVDLIISEWMGTLLIFEYMLESVLWARDTYLKPEGKMFPSKAELFLVPANVSEYYDKNIYFWKEVYGIDMSFLIPEAEKQVSRKPIHNYEAKINEYLSTPQIIMKLNLLNTKIENLEKYEAPIIFKIKEDSLFHGFISWFDVDFEKCDQNCESLKFSTDPNHELTHWKQDLFLLENPIEVKKDDLITGTIYIERNAYWRRHCTILFNFEIERTKQKYSKTFKLWRD